MFLKLKLFYPSIGNRTIQSILVHQHISSPEKLVIRETSVYLNLKIKISFTFVCCKFLIRHFRKNKLFSAKCIGPIFQKMYNIYDKLNNLPSSFKNKETDFYTLFYRSFSVFTLYRLTLISCKRFSMNPSMILIYRDLIIQPRSFYVYTIRSYWHRNYLENISRFLYFNK